jgi:hypothetical protein
MPLNEKASRRDTFAGGIPVVLGDGQTWVLAKPKVGAFPEVDASGNVCLGRIRRSFGPEYDALLDSYLECTEAADEIVALMALALDLLRRNYDLPTADLITLVPRWFDEEENTEMWRAIADVALGRSPKPTPVG